ncbi:hypothetical protein B296_00048733 [Ensete ventricosum]|uniref:Uncharacterized protein n=1 Tax=Ensete ventricosum TaxID=4639 RepID=A0A426XI97_ENSVE|nr:hypothetical protein B296_00048733 [Ensete ventricosum]
MSWCSSAQQYSSLWSLSDKDSRREIEHIGSPGNPSIPSSCRDSVETSSIVHYHLIGVNFCLVDEFRLRILVSKHLLVQARVRWLARSFLDTEWKLVRISSNSELGLGSQLLDWWSPGEEGVLQFGSVADSCKKVGSGAFIVGVVDRSYLITLLLLWLTMLVVLALRRLQVGGVDLTCVRSTVRLLAPPIFPSGQLPASGRPCRRASYPRV